MKMHSFIYRWSYLLTYFFIALAGSFFACYISTYNKDYKIKVNLKKTDVFLDDVSLPSDPWKYSAVVFLRFNLQTDLTEIIKDWNVKQVVVLLALEYVQNNNFNKVVLWDKVISRGEYAKIHLKNEPTTYYFWENEKESLGSLKNVTLTVSCSIMPIAGKIQLKRAQGSYSFKFTGNDIFLTQSFNE